MRVKDEVKQEALFRATVKVVNRIGFASSSVSKIAKEAGVSPATIYVYYKNKEDLLITTYLTIKSKLTEFAFDGVNDALPIRDAFRQMWVNLFRFTVENSDYFQFSEQFANSPIHDQVDQSEIDRMYRPVGRLIQKGIDQKVIKNIDVDIIGAFVFYPVIILANPRLCKSFEGTDEQVVQSFQLAWDAIKL